MRTEWPLSGWLALERQPEQGTWWMGLGLAMAAQGKSAEAHAAYRRSLTAGNLPENLEEFVRAKLAEQGLICHEPFNGQPAFGEVRDFPYHEPTLRLVVTKQRNSFATEEVWQLVVFFCRFVRIPRVGWIASPGPISGVGFYIRKKREIK